MALIKFTTEGYVVHTVPDDPIADATDEFADDGSEGFDGRIPLLLKGRDVYVGRPNWYHHQLLDYFHIQAADKEGYIGGGEQWGSGALQWYGGSTLDDASILEALAQAGVHATQAGPEPAWDDDLWS